MPQWLEVTLCVLVGFNLGALTIQEIHDYEKHREIMRQIRAIGKREYDG